MVEHNLDPKRIIYSNLGNRKGSNNEKRKTAEIAQLVEHNLAKVGVASSSLVFRSKSSLREI